MTFDPFADTADEAQTAAPQTNPWEDTTVTETPATVSAPSVDGNKVRVTLKGGTGYDAPWITIDGKDIPDTLNQITEHAQALKELVDQTAKVGKYFAGTGGSSGGRQGGQSSNGGGGQQKPAHQQAPGGQTKTCDHGDMEWKSGISKAGNPYKGFFCPSNDRNDQCKPHFAK